MGVGGAAEPAIDRLRIERNPKLLDISVVLTGTVIKPRVSTQQVVGRADAVSRFAPKET
ncbi:hypothetical protein M378DRAFT_171044 [Amanita muscaria Koide BX008]|uniref:Uncharacterized protein n=1 Tax=Amanita muscaria (strain Koide BX008) TaxID=946122 RepID=A0A0C2S5R8_AMAMK|nr:hypothetical protein M378DRAFT_171044 [Amanita muscaria Koide BX008]